MSWDHQWRGGEPEWTSDDDLNQKLLSTYGQTVFERSNIQMASGGKFFPARLHVLMASVSEVGVVFRRGPTDAIATFLWDRVNDTFSLGQWYNGRIYERRSDLSPDGKHLLYFSSSFEEWPGNTETAISKAPYLKPLDVYSGLGTYEGGGLFHSDTSYMIHAIWGGSTRKKTSSLVRDDTSETEIVGTGDLPVYCVKLKRDGWRVLPGGQQNFEKELPFGWNLRKQLREDYTNKVKRGRGCCWDEHQLINTQSGASVDGSDWEWADWDRNSIVWATKGCIYRASIKTTGELEAPVMLHDFNPYTFKECEAPY